MVEQFKRFRDGRHIVSNISIRARGAKRRCVHSHMLRLAENGTVSEDMTVGSNQNSRARRYGQNEVIIGDVCVRGGKVRIWCKRSLKCAV